MPTYRDSAEGTIKLSGDVVHEDWEVGMTPARSATIAVIFSSGLTVGVAVGLTETWFWGVLAAAGAMVLTIGVLALTHRWRWLRRRLTQGMVWVTRL
jgi:hypothetical protein